LVALAPPLRGRRDRLRTFALEPHRLPFERRESRELDQILVPKRAHAFELALNELDLLGLGLLQRDVSADLLFKLADPLLQLCFLPGARGSPQVEQLALAVDRARDVGIVLARKQRRVEHDLIGAVAFAREA